VSVSRLVQAGGKSPAELRHDLERHRVRLNEASEQLFRHPAFTTAAASYLLPCVEVAVIDLGFPEGATMEALLSGAAEAGLAVCPLEVGPHLRLQYLDQPEGFVGHPSTKHRAPPGSLTVVSSPLSEDHETPKGFYLRRISGELWLRGYRSGPEHVWSPEDRLLFCRMK